MADIKLTQLVSRTEELTPNESHAIIGGNFIKTITGITQIGTGILSLHAGLNTLQSGNTQQPNAPSGGSNPTQILAYQEFFAPDTIAGI
ncbi:hypothetical protein [Mastigocoleus testarum]|uniref:Uncharacterized protein n=1 Tax=Mastigocoleus testarum BC008 TaxID=371196 RepID=A0A0V7ZKT3_9CYAN|nr:hypothetical protein [Mastigocoleus testarum]KST65248.1 hypothetical protein BC008_20875 [Mastigocoleus testarum BC008]